METIQIPETGIIFPNYPHRYTLNLLPSLPFSNELVDKICNKVGRLNTETLRSKLFSSNCDAPENSLLLSYFQVTVMLLKISCKGL